MKVQEFVGRFSIARRELCGPCAGISVHLCRAGGQSFGAVLGSSEGDYLVKLKPIQVNGFISHAARAVYAAVDVNNTEVA